MFNILLVDDEIKITEVIKAYLDKEGYNTFIAHDGQKALELFTQEEFDLVILDRMLPDISGEEICKRIRETSLVHIIMLTAKTEDDDKIDGFNLGCDDYVCKPFNVKELVLRIKAVFRKIEKEEIIKVGDEIEVNTLSHEVKIRGTEVSLTNTEYKILLLLVNNQKKIFTREELLELVTEDHYEKFDRIIDVHIKNLRQKIEEDTKKPKIIQTVYGVGYKFGL
ncbi:MAG: response regulator transcription factor [Clostridiales bacterium]|uniref:response regulator transcription factor n=1 Tax=Terrisporobacter sp. TaxID=1965305 RepID=UPI002A3AD826|nr:response regulator transcription factor [Terrisporobacter sp.]MCI7205865.1 response regulator transcription factor [Clostridium sp.]MDD5878220.1 response regulator transcription factor [Clostridiales bacterium]MDD7754785.1 response regulator transcription factor [Clostridiales bacterium]MDY4134578.1 response regulator transcription factor [Terrisporobacter sp.]